MDNYNKTNLNIDFSVRERVLDFALKEYGTHAEYPWADTPEYAVLRHEDNEKWYGVLMTVKRRTLGLRTEKRLENGNSEDEKSEDSSLKTSLTSFYNFNGFIPKAVSFESENREDFDAGISENTMTENWSAEDSHETFDPDSYVDILNVKLDPLMVEMLRHQRGYLPAYHMSKKYWLTILLDGSVPEQNVFNLLDESYSITAGKKNAKAARRKGPRDWLIPSNPKYFDIVSAFEKEKVIDWKQSSDVHVGDIVYMYVAAPYSAILYKCRAIEADIPYQLQTKDLTVKKIMRIELLEKYDPSFMPLNKLKDEFGVYAVRGPRGIPHSLKMELEHQ